MSRSPKRQLNLLSAIIILDLLSATMTVPLFPILVADPAHTILGPNVTVGAMKIYLGLLFGLYAIAQFLGAPYFGVMSDRFGRKKVLSFIFIMNIIQYIIIAYSIYIKSFALLVIGRTFAGVAGGTVFIEQSAIADLSKPEDKAKNMGIIGIAFGVGLIFGPLIGTFLTNPDIHPSFNLATPFLTILVINIFNLFLMAKYLDEPLKDFNRGKFSLMLGFKNLMLAFTDPKWRVLFTCALFISFGLFFFLQFFQVILIDRFHYSIMQQGLTLAYCGLIMVLAQGLLLPYLTRRFSVSKLMLIFMPIMAVGYLALTLAYSQAGLFIALFVLVGGQGICTPGLLALISNKAGKDVQGATIGINQSIQSFASAIPPLVAASLVASYLDFPLIFGAVVTMIAFVIFYLYEYRTK